MQHEFSQNQKAAITKLSTDAIVNAVNEGLWEGSGICGAIFAEVGSGELNMACRAIGHCDTGSEVITLGDHLKAKYIMHAVGSRWTDGKMALTKRGNIKWVKYWEKNIP